MKHFIKNLRTGAYKNYTYHHDLHTKNKRYSKSLAQSLASSVVQPKMNKRLLKNENKNASKKHKCKKLTSNL